MSENTMTIEELAKFDYWFYLGEILVDGRAMVTLGRDHVEWRYTSFRVLDALDECVEKATEHFHQTRPKKLREALQWIMYGVDDAHLLNGMVRWLVENHPTASHKSDVRRVDSTHIHVGPGQQEIDMATLEGDKTDAYGHPVIDAGIAYDEVSDRIYIYIAK